MIIHSPYRIKGIVSAYPSELISTDDLSFDSELERSVFMRKMGVHQRRSSNGRYTVKDLGLKAIQNLLEHLKWESEDIDILISVTQVPDHTVPGNSYLYQKDLALSENCSLLDLNAGCIGFIQGLVSAIAHGQLLSASRIIIVAGDTDILTDHTRVESNKLMGDAVCAIALEAGQELLTSNFKIHHHGIDFQAIFSAHSGARAISQSSDSKLSQVIQMDGEKIFQYIAQKVIYYLKELESSLQDKNELYFIHQPNLMYHQYIAKKMKWNLTLCPTIIADFGNVSSATIPLTIQQHSDLITSPKKVLLTSFGVGLSFAAIQLDLFPDIYTSEVVC